MYRLVTLTALAMGCSGAAGTPTTKSTATSPTLQVAGTYATAVSLAVDSCGGSVVQSMPTVVAHVADASTLSLAHAGSLYDGTITRDGTFQTVAGTPLVLNGFSYVVIVSGKFSTTGFDAAASVDRTTVGAPSTRCRYVAKWVGTRASGTNVIPEP